MYLPTGKCAIKAKWVFKRKHNADGKVISHKARFVVKGFSQIEGVNYQETFGPVARYESIRLLIALATIHDWPWEIHQLDFITVFLNGDIPNTA